MFTEMGGSQSTPILRTNNARLFELNISYKLQAMFILHMAFDVSNGRKGNVTNIAYVILNL